jgi:hypothetical protein
MPQGKTFTWEVHPLDARIVVVRASAISRRISAEVAEALQLDLVTFSAWLRTTFSDRPFRGLNVLADLAMAYNDEDELVIRSALTINNVLPVERGAYVIERGTTRLQFARIIREDGYGERLRVFATEDEALRFLRAD